MRKQATLAVPPAAEETLYQKLTEARQRYQLFPPLADGQPRPLVVAVSGGADSLCLLYTLAHLASNWRLALHVAHVDHNLRPASAREAAFVAATAAQLQLPFHSTQLAAGSLAHQPGGIEAAARRARYAFLIQTAINVTPSAQVPQLVLAHQADDQAETFLLHLVRGSGLPGLGGMKWVNQLRVRDFVDAAHLEQAGHPPMVVDVVRPLLHVRRPEIVAYLNARQLTWCEDESNQDRAFLRNRLRHEVLPVLEQMNPHLVETLGRTANVLNAEATRLQQLDRATFLALGGTATQVGEHEPPVRVVLAFAQFLALDVAAQRGVLRQALAALQGSFLDLEFELVERLLEALPRHPQAGGPYPLVQQLAWSVAAATQQLPARFSLHRRDVLPFLPEQPYIDDSWQQRIGCVPLVEEQLVPVHDQWALRVQAIARQDLPADWQRTDTPWQAYLDAAQGGDLALTTPQPGWRFAPLGMRGQQKTLGNFFTDHKVPASLRAGWPVVIDQAQQVVLWVCGLQVGHHARLTTETTRVLHLCWVKQG